MSSDLYINLVIKVVEARLWKTSRHQPMMVLKGGTLSPLPFTYKPELDVTHDFNADVASQYAQLIGGILC